MQKEKKSILIALVLGDGNLNVRRDMRHPGSWHQELCIKHSIAQREYAEYKAMLVHKVCGGNIPRVISFNNSGYPGVRFTKSHRYFRYLRRLLYIEGKKTYTRKALDFLTPQGLAIWYQDDGGMSHQKREGKIHGRRLYLNTHLTRAENQVIIDYFREVWAVAWTQVLNRGLYRLSCGAIEGKKFVALIHPYIHPTMLYKIDFNYT